MVDKIQKKKIQKEQHHLQLELNNCIADSDFLGAHYFSTPLNIVREKLRVAENLQNPFYDKISGLQRQIKQLENLEKHRDGKERRYAFMLRKLPQLKEELQQLLKSKASIFQIDGEEFLHAIENLIAKNIARFDLLITDNQEIRIQFSKIENSIQLNISYNKGDKFKYRIDKHQEIKLKQIGFIFVDDRIEFKVDPIQKNQGLFVLEIVARVMFDVFRMYGGLGAKIVY